MTPPGFLQVGVVGAGFVARRAHLPAWRAVPGARVTALCDVDPAALASAGDDFGIGNRFAGIGALLASGVDAVSVCASNAAHFPLALAALEAGKHVLCEKPLAVTAAEARLLGAAADARGLVLMTQHQLRFDAPAAAALARVRAGGLGKVYHARVRALRRDRAPTLPGFTDVELSGGGAVLDLGVHALDIALLLMGFPKVARVSGSIRTNFALGHAIPGHWGEWDRARFSVEDFGAGFVHFENGATLSLECAWLGHYGEEGLGCELFGEAGSLRWPSVDLAQGDSARAGTAAMDPHFTAVAAFYEAVRRAQAGEVVASPVPWREAAASVEIIEALYASARAGREVTLPLKK